MIPNGGQAHTRLMKYLFLLLLWPLAAESALADVTTGEIRGAVFTVGSDGSQSFLEGAEVHLESPPLSVQTVTDARGQFTFKTLAPAVYRIAVKAPGLAGFGV